MRRELIFSSQLCFWLGWKSLITFKVEGHDSQTRFMESDNEQNRERWAEQIFTTLGDVSTIYFAWLESYDTD
jgi:hypothetical protein